MGREIIYVIAGAARKFKNVSAFWEKLFKGLQYWIAVSIARQAT